MRMGFGTLKEDDGYYRLTVAAEGHLFVVGNATNEQCGINSFQILEVLEGPAPVPHKFQIAAFMLMDELIREDQQAPKAA